MLIGRNDYVAWIPCLAWYLGVPLVIRKSRDPPHHRSGWTPDSDYNSFPVSSLYVARPQFLNKWEIRLAERALRIWGIVQTFVPQPILRNVSIHHRSFSKIVVFTPPILFDSTSRDPFVNIDLIPKVPFFSTVCTLDGIGVFGMPTNACFLARWWLNAEFPSAVPQRFQW